MPILSAHHGEPREGERSNRAGLAREPLSIASAERTMIAPGCMSGHCRRVAADRGRLSDQHTNTGIEAR
jgi:hypothetical protein